MHAWVGHSSRQLIQQLRQRVQVWSRGYSQTKTKAQITANYRHYGKSLGSRSLSAINN